MTKRKDYIGDFLVRTFWTYNAVAKDEEPALDELGRKMAGRSETPKRKRRAK